MKYIMFEIEAPVKRLVPIIFPDFMVHADIATVIRVVLEDEHKMKVKGVKSAGTYSVLNYETSGHSDSLGIDSKKNDCDVIRMYDYFHGIL